ncbi:GTP pyrophosphokinase [Citrobacter sp. OP27]
MIVTLEKLFADHEIDLFSLDGRVKDVDSYMEKIERKGYTEPLREVEDICGIRVICYYSAELEKIESVLNDEFNVLSFSDKKKESGEDRFGYLSMHYIVSLKDDWLHSPLYRDFSELKIEIQVRTILMHTWAAISHKLMYKKESDAPLEINRKLNRLSALIELADEQFDLIRVAKDQYMEDVKDGVDDDALLNPFNIISLVEKYSPEREYTSTDVIRLIDEIDGLDIRVKDFDNFLKSNVDLILDLEKKSAELNNNPTCPYWTLAGFCRVVLDLANDQYYKKRWEENGVLSTAAPEFKKLRDGYRKKIKAKMKH